MTFKKSIALLLSGSMLATAALTGCGSDNTAAAVSNTGKDLLDQIQARAASRLPWKVPGPLDLSR
ncbi:MAG: hypothetical protein ACLURV_08635 [Gallintestinimicrobium sp.]